jgi:hypothetical protein
MPTYLDPVSGLSLSQALVQAATAAPAHRARLCCYELMHASRTYPIRVVNDTVPLVATLEADAPRDASSEVTFSACRVSADIADESPDSPAGQVDLRIDNVSGHIMDMLRSALNHPSAAVRAAPWELIERVYVSDETDGPAILPVFKVTPIRVTVSGAAAVISCRARNPSNRSIPAITFTPESYPGLVA